MRTRTSGATAGQVRATPRYCRRDLCARHVTDRGRGGHPTASTAGCSSTESAVVNDIARGIAAGGCSYARASRRLPWRSVLWHSCHSSSSSSSTATTTTTTPTSSTINSSSSIRCNSGGTSRSNSRGRSGGNTGAGPLLRHCWRIVMGRRPRRHTGPCTATHRCAAAASTAGTIQEPTDRSRQSVSTTVHGSGCDGRPVPYRRDINTSPTQLSR